MGKKEKKRQKKENEDVENVEVNSNLAPELTYLNFGEWAEIAPQCTRLVATPTEGG
jgi:hypothetical protein